MQNSDLIGCLVQEMQFRNYSERTIVTYSRLLANVEKYFQLPIDNITADQLKSYLHQRIINQEVSISSINQTISAFKIMQVDILGRSWEKINIKRPRRVKKLPVVLSIGEVHQLIEATPNIKHKAILMLSYSAGLRRSEAQQILPSAIDSKRMMVHVVQGKGKKDRYTILSLKTLEMLRLHYKLHRPVHFLFEAQGKKGKYLSVQTLNTIVKDCAAKAGINKRISFHTLRHSFATHLLEQGVNIRLIQQFLGHTSLKTTAGYLHLVNVQPSGIKSPLDLMSL
ncbi:MAG: tyrosine-type recombinase/integrase [Bacteroidales bacterium]|nr:tyrosine-type recombinase/integrase [Bacteroidales bacterium]